MTWEPAKSRWRKMHKGKLYTVSCDTLGCPRTKAESYQAANAWWESRLAGLTPSHPHATVLQDLDSKIAWSDRHEPENASTLRRHREYVQDDTAGEIPWGVTSDVGRAVWNDRLMRDTAPNPATPTIEGLSQTWIEGERSKAAGGLLKPRSFANSRTYCLYFTRFVGESLPPSDIGESTVDAYYHDLLRKVADGDISPSTARDRMKVAVRFIKWLWERRCVELPRNLNRTFRFNVTAPVIETFTREEVGTLLATAKGQNRLHVLLSLNCGMYPGDIAKLRDDEVDWTAGTITRKRSKTQTQQTVPTVTYPLWDKTARLLREHRSGGPVVLLNSKARPWLRESVKPDGSVSFSDVLSDSLVLLR